MSQEIFDVIIVGAGAAGLMAAWELIQVDKKVLILEARDRIGGRILTLEGNGFAMPVELGAEFVHGKLELTQRLFRKGNINYYKVNGDIWRKEKTGLEKEGDFIDDYNLLNQKFKSLERDIPVAEFINEHLNEPEYEELRISLKTYVEGYYAADTTRASTLAMKEELQKADEEQYRVEGGYKQLIEFFIKELKKKNCPILLSNPVQYIKWQKGKVEIRTDKGIMYSKKVLVSVPLGVLQAGRPSFDPALPQMADAARQLGFGPAIKLILQFAKTFWKEKDYTGQKDLRNAGFVFSEEEVPTWWTEYPKQAPIIVGWLGGPNAEKFKELSEEDILQKALNSLANIFTIQSVELRRMLDHYVVSNWAKDPFCCGGYSYDVVDGNKQKRILKEPVENTVFFAGEGLFEGLEVGTVEAALVNGRETAHKLIASF
jgi:monoamine oxidase